MFGGYAFDKGRPCLSPESHWAKAILLLIMNARGRRDWKDRPVGVDIREVEGLGKGGV